MNDADDNYRAMWAGLVDQGAFQSHRDLHPEWDRQRDQYSWFLLPSDPSVREAMLELQGQLSAEFLTPLPAASLHHTLMSIVPGHDVNDSELRELVGDAQHIVEGIASWGPFEVTGPNATIEGVFCEVRPWGPIVALRRQLFESAHDVLGADRVLAKPKFQPHMSMAYASGAADAGEMIVRIEHLGRRTLGTEPFGALHLVHLQWDGATYQFETVEQIRLT